MSNAAKVNSDLSASIKDTLIGYGCDANCLNSISLDDVSPAMATSFCSCPSIIQVKRGNLKSMDITSVLKNVKKSNTLSMVATPEVVPQTSYTSAAAVALAAVVAGGFVYNKKKNALIKEDDTFTSLI
jgi:hypothetical protein